jgi:ATP-dependent DNA ligase
MSTYGPDRPIEASGGLEYRYELPQPDWDNSAKTVTDLAEILAEVDEMGRSRNPKKALIRELIEEWSTTDAYCAVRAIDGSDIPHPEIPLDVEQNAIHDALGVVFGDGSRESGEQFAEDGDNVTAGLRQAIVTVPEPRDVGLNEIYGEWLYELARADGPNAQAELLADYFRQCRKPWVLTHIINNDLTLYFGTYMILRGLEDEYDGDVFRQYRTEGDVGCWFLQAARGDATETLEPHDYHETMKAESTDATGVSEELDHGKWLAQTKYDGARVFVHCAGDGDVRAYAGGGRDITSALPELDDIEWPDASFIFDCEATPYQDGEVVPFENIMTRMTRTGEVDADEHDTTVVFKFFDCLFWKGRDITRRQYQDRFEIVKAAFHPRSVARTGSDLETTFHNSIEDGHEGLVLKRKDGEHDIGGRGDQWLKWKPEPETLDVLVIDCTRGSGAIGDRMGSLEVALVGPDGEPESVGEVGSGFTMDDRTEFWHDDEVGELRGQVIEVEFEEFQPNDDGWGLRFPTFERRRPDGEVDTIERAARLQDREEQYREFEERVVEGGTDAEGLGDLFE